MKLRFQPVAIRGPLPFLCAFGRSNAAAPEPLIHPPVDPCCHARHTGTNLGFRVLTERQFGTGARILTADSFAQSGRATQVPQQFNTEQQKGTNNQPPSHWQSQAVTSSGKNNVFQPSSSEELCFCCQVKSSGRCYNMCVSILWEEPEYTNSCMFFANHCTHWWESHIIGNNSFSNLLAT